MIGTRELAQKVGLSEMRIRQLAREIPGAVKHSFGWLFPEDADQKPPLTNRPRVGRKRKEAQP